MISKKKGLIELELMQDFMERQDPVVTQKIL